MTWSLTISGHAHGETLLEATVLAPVTVHAHDETVFILHTHLVVDILLNAAPEETLRKEGMKNRGCEGCLLCHCVFCTQWKGKTWHNITFLWSHLAALAGMHAIMEPRCDVPAHLTQKHHTSGFCERGSHNGCQVKKHNEKLLMAKEGGEQGGGWRVGTYWWTCQWSHKAFWQRWDGCRSVMTPS